MWIDVHNERIAPPEQDKDEDDIDSDSNRIQKDTNSKEGNGDKTLKVSSLQKWILLYAINSIA